MAFFDDPRLDEVAASSASTLLSRCLVAVGIGVVAAVNLDVRLGVGWLALALTCEGWSWLAWRPVLKGGVFTTGQRRHYVVSLFVTVAVWSAMGLAAWTSEGGFHQAAAVAIWTCQLLCAASFAFQTRSGYLIIAAPPSLAMVCAALLAHPQGWPAAASVLGLFFLVVVYATSTAMQTAGFRKTLDQAQQSLRESEARAEASAQVKAEFLANMSHELRTPLTAVIGFADLLRRAPTLTGPDQRRADLIHGASTTLLGIVNDVLDVSKMDAGALDLDPHPFDLIALVRDTMALVELQAQDKGLALAMYANEPAIGLVGDSGRLRQVVLNLLTNAIKFTAQGGVTITLRAGPEREGLRPIRVEVRDTGIGVAADKQAALFERFAQADGSISRQFGGTGLGLAICRRLIELMGGRIGLASAQGLGSTFWFELDLPPAPAELVAATVHEAPQPLRRMKVLVADDHPVNRELIRALLQPYDLDLDLVSDGAQAVQAVQGADYDLVLMDIQMPVMDGLAAAERIRALEGAAGRTPIVAMTANVFPEQVAQYRAAGMDDHLGKPIDPQALVRLLVRFGGAQA